MPFVRLNVEGVQNAAALRYHAWYVRVAPALFPPRIEIGVLPTCG
jgi:hypothetical protein